MVKKQFALKALARVLSCIWALMASVMAPSAWSAIEWKPELVAVKGVRAPSDPIRLVVSGLAPATFQNLTLDLDDIDVTAFVTRQGRFAIFTPPQPLEFGEHRLRLVEYAPDGNIIERGAWTVEIRKSRAFREAQLQSALTLTASRRIADDNLVDPPGKAQASGTAQLQAAVANADWRATGTIDLMYNKQKAFTARQKDRLDMGEYLLVTDALGARLNVGHHTAAPESLIAQGFRRRGVSLGTSSADAGVSVTGFIQRTESIVGFQEGLGIGDKDNRVDGIAISARPISANRDALALTVSYLTGQGPINFGEGVAGDPTVFAGNAASLVADSLLLERRLRLRGEVAKTRFDPDGDGIDSDLDGTVDLNLPAEPARAYTALVTYTPWHDKIAKGQALAWTVGLENKRIGTFFDSPANPSGVPEGKSLRTFSQFNWYGLGLYALLGRETSNADDIQNLETTETTQAFLQASYAPIQDYPAIEAGQEPEVPWYGQPYFTLSLSDADQDIIDAGPFLPEGRFTATYNATINASFTYPTWSWSITRAHGRSEDFSGQNADTRTTSTQLSARFQLGNRLELEPSIGIDDTEQTEPALFTTVVDSKTARTELRIGYTFTEKLNGNLGITMNRIDTSDDSTDQTTTDVNFSLRYAVLRAQAARPGLALSLTGQYHDEEDRGTSAIVASNDSHQIFLQGELSWYPSY